MKLQTLVIENFGPYRERQKIEFPDSESANIMVVFGENMAGKTTILNAIRWTLYGKALDRSSETIDLVGLANKKERRKGNWKISTKIEFTVGDKKYELRRVAKPHDLVGKPTDSGDFDVTTYLREEGNVIDAEKTEKKINDFIPEEISRFYLFDGELLQEYEELVKRDSKKSSKIKKDIEKLLGVPSLEAGRDDLKSLLNDARKEQEKATDHLDVVQGSVERQNKLQEEIGTLEDSLENLKDKNEERREKIGEIRSELSSIEEAKSLKNERERLKNEIDELESKIESERLKYFRSLNKCWKDLIQPQVSAIRESAEKKKNKEEKSLKKIGKIKERIEIIQKAIDEKCPVCNNKPDSEHRESMRRELGELKATIEDGIDTYQQENGVSISDINKVEGRNYFKDAINYQNNIDEYVLQKRRNESKIEEIDDKMKNHSIDKVVELESKKEKYTKLIGKDEGKIKDIEEKIDKKEDKLNQVTKQITENPEARKHKATRAVSVYNDLYQCFKKSIDRLRDRLRQWVEEKATETFLELTTDSTYQELEINNNYGLSIVDSSGDQVLNRSAGAEQVVALSLLTALNKTADQPGPVVIDTPFARLDPNHRRNVLEYAPQMAEQIVFLVHAGEIDPDGGLDPVAERVGKRYRIDRKDSSESEIIPDT
jgi:DNA sulfur modification protein DndD